MKYTLPLLLLLAGGCAGARTVGPEDFLYAYRCGVMPGDLPTDATATYTGHDEAYHYLEFRNNGPIDIFMGAASPEHKARCRVDQLPVSFPSGFEPLRGRGTDGFENGEDTREYVRAYMAKHHDDTPADRPPPDPSPRRKKGHNDDPRSD